MVENVEVNNHLQPWMVDEALPTELSTYSKSWAAVVIALQRDFKNTSIPLASRRTLLLPNITHLELGLPDFKQSVIVETRYSAEKGAWAFRLVKALQGDQSRADILVITPLKWTLHNEASAEHIGDGKIAPMSSVPDFPVDQNIEAQAAARLPSAQAAKAVNSPAGAATKQ